VSGHTCAYAKALPVKVRALSQLGGVKASYWLEKGVEVVRDSPASEVWTSSPSASGQHQESNLSAYRGPWREGTGRSVMEVSGRQEETLRT